MSRATYLHIYGDQASHKDYEEKLVPELGASLQIDTPVSPMHSSSPSTKIRPGTLTTLTGQNMQRNK